MRQTGGWAEFGHGLRRGASRLLPAPAADAPPRGRPSSARRVGRCAMRSSPSPPSASGPSQPTSVRPPTAWTSSAATSGAALRARRARGHGGGLGLRRLRARPGGEPVRRRPGGLRLAEVRAAKGLARSSRCARSSASRPGSGRRHPAAPRRRRGPPTAGRCTPAWPRCLGRRTRWASSGTPARSCASTGRRPPRGLRAAGLNGLQANLLTELLVGWEPFAYTASRGWSPEAMQAGMASLEARGLVAGGALTEAGRRLRPTSRRPPTASCSRSWTPSAATCRPRSTLDGWSRQIIDKGWFPPDPYKRAAGDGHPAGSRLTARPAP